MLSLLILTVVSKMSELERQQKPAFNYSDQISGLLAIVVVFLIDAVVEFQFAEDSILSFAVPLSLIIGFYVLFSRSLKRIKQQKLHK